MEQTPIPSGVNVVEPPMAAAPQPQMAAQPMAAATPTQSNFFGGINAVEFLIGVSLVTFFCFGIYYYKMQTKVVNPAIQSMNDKVDKLDSDLAKLEEVVAPQQ
jgi:hypothetical protein